MVSNKDSENKKSVLQEDQKRELKEKSKSMVDAVLGFGTVVYAIGAPLVEGAAGTLESRAKMKVLEWKKKRLKKEQKQKSPTKQ